jgi:hypothetical protein
MNAAMTASREGRRQQLHWTWRDRPKMIANLGYGEELWIEGGGLGPNSFSVATAGVGNSGEAHENYKCDVTPAGESLYLSAGLCES